MESLKSFWAMIQGDPKFMRRVNGWLTIFWIVMIPLALIMGWLQSVVFVSALSLWALVSGHWSAWQAARVEVKQQEEERQDTEGKIAKRVIRDSNLHKSRQAKAKRKKSSTN
jgi:hypothetical protein